MKTAQSKKPKMANRFCIHVAASAASVSRETLKALIVVTIKLFQLTSKLTPQRCKYHPSCSHYALGAVQTHGPIKGSMLSALRIVRCNPWSNGGIDEVPAKDRKIEWRRFGSSRSKHELC